MTQEITKILNLPEPVKENPVVEQTLKPVPVETKNTTDDEELDRDFQLVKGNLEELSSKGVAILDDLTDLARSSQMAGAYEAMAPLIKSITDANNGILDAHLKRKKIKEPTKNQPAPGTTNIDKAIVFNGSTKDLLQSLNDKKE